MNTFLATFLRLLPAAALVAGLASGASAAPAATADTAATRAARAALSAPPARGTSGLGFVANRGQWDADVLFMTPIKGGRAWVTATGIVYDFSKAAKRKQGEQGAQPPTREPHRADKPDAKPHPERVQGHVVKLAFAGALQATVRPKGKLTTRLNYLLGNDPAKHAKNVSAYSAVNLEGMWPGVDLRLAQGPGGLSLSFKAADAAALAKARVAIDGAALLEGRGEGALVTTSIGQRSLGAVAVSLGQARYAGQLSGGTVALASAPQAPKAQADAASESGGGLVYSTFLGGSGLDAGESLKVGADGAAYVTGWTWSSSFPTTPGAYDTTIGYIDAFVTKLSTDGSGLVYATFLGGSGRDEGYALAVDAAGAAYVTGVTESSTFPTTPGAFDTTLNIGTGAQDAFVTKLSADGSALVYSTYLGGGHFDYGTAVAVDASGAAYVTGLTQSGNFPTTPGAFDTTYNVVGVLYHDAFVTKLSADGSALVYSSYLGGSDTDYSQALAVDASGAAYVAGYTDSSDYPTTPGAYDTSDNVNYDLFVTKLAADGSALVYSTYLGGNWYDTGRGLAVDASGAAYVTGDTSSVDFPTTPGAYDRTLRGSNDAFVTKLAADGSALVYSTLLGGDMSDFGRALAVDSSGAAFVTGSTFSPDFPTTPGAFDTSYNSGVGGVYRPDVFVTKLVADGSALVYSTFFGGEMYDSGGSLAVDASGAVYITGDTQAADLPTTPGAYDTTFNGGDDAFVTKLDLGGVASGVELSATASATTVAAGGSFTVDYTVSNHTGEPVTGDLFFTAKRSGQRVAYGLVLSNTTVAANGTITGSFTQLVPDYAEPGVYTYTVRIGNAPDTSKDKVSFKITVTGAQRAGSGATAWQAVRARQ